MIVKNRIADTRITIWDVLHYLEAGWSRPDIGLFHQNWRQEVWEFLRLPQVSFADLGLPPDASDREVWEVCQRAQVVLVTANCNDAGPESLESTIQHQNTPQSLPVFTLANDQRVLRDRQYAETVANRLIEALFDIELSRYWRIYLP